LIKDNMDILERIAQALLEKETLDAKEFEEVFLGRKLEEGEYTEYDRISDGIDSNETTSNNTVDNTDENEKNKED
ncbi:MAG TPA: zinc metalloprotease, partial [Tissierellaceae bacterium]|nr:zinc metalloprotease [Tissierellaceae bacterium]